MEWHKTTFLAENFTPLRDEESTFRPTPSCQLCSSTEPNLLRCGGCKVVHYCSKDHQILDRPKHVSICKSITRYSARLNREELKLRNQPDDGQMFAPPHVFEKHVGHFWGLPNTRPYMRARYALVEAILQVRTRDAVAAALTHLMDCMRLCRLDNMGVRDLIPALMLRLGKEQECYDFVKWHATTGSEDDYDWADMQQPFLDVKDADMLESPIYLLKDRSDLSHLVSITLLNIRLLLTVRAGSEGKEMLRSSPTFQKIQDGIERDAREQWPGKIITILEKHVKILYRAVDFANAHFWPAFLNPQSHLDARPPTVVDGGIQHMQMVLKQNYDAWKESPGAIEVVAAIFHGRDY